VDNWHRVRTVEVILTYRYLNVQYHGHEELILPPCVYSDNDAASLATFAELQDISSGLKMSDAIMHLTSNAMSERKEEIS